MNADEGQPDQFGTEWVDLSVITPARELIALLPAQAALRLQVAPLQREGDRLLAVYVDSKNLDAMDYLAHRWFCDEGGQLVQWCWAGPEAFVDFIAHHWSDAGAK